MKIQSLKDQFVHIFVGKNWPFSVSTSYTSYTDSMQGKKTTIHDKQAFLEALKKRKGIVTLACKEVSLSPMTFYKWLKVDPKFEQKADEIREVEIGIIAEDRLAEAIIVKGDLNAVKFYLQSRNRKYMQKIQTETYEDPTKALADLLSLDE